MANTEERQDISHAKTLIAGYYADPAKRLSFARELFNRTARHYDPINRLFSLGTGTWYRRTCLLRAGLKPGLRVVDVAVGTGLLAREALRITGDRRAVIGIDVSEKMLCIAHKNLAIPLIQGAAEVLPIADDCADFVTIGYALRHVADLESVFRECFRVLRPNGMVVFLEITVPRRRFGRLLASAYIGAIMPFLSLITTGDLSARELMHYHWATIVKCVPPEVIMSAMRNAGFQEVECRTELELFGCYIARKSNACVQLSP